MKDLTQADLDDLVERHFRVRINQPSPTFKQWARARTGWPEVPTVRAPIRFKPKEIKVPKAPGMPKMPSMPRMG